MNRLILIGNGFDLAHGKETSYINFIQWYVLKCVKAGLDSGSTSEHLITVERNDDYIGEFTATDLTLKNWIKTWINNRDRLRKFGSGSRGFSGNIVYPISLKIKSALLTMLLANCATHRWVDIEATFYEQLTTILNSKRSIEFQEKELDELNRSMRIFSQELQEYLKNFQTTSTISEYDGIIYSPVESRDLQSESRQKTNNISDLEDIYGTKLPNDMLLLDFNYTNTSDSYIRNSFYINTQLIKIHGKLHDTDNPIIFGFGDEVDKRYEEMENSRAKGWFDYIKSFWYLKTNNYRNLISFIDSDKYQVIVLGHSCGLSDRTMLQMIFQHENCRSIKLYYYGSKEVNNHRQTLHEVARHFKDKGLMRRRIVSEENSERMPQYND